MRITKVAAVVQDKNKANDAPIYFSKLAQATFVPEYVLGYTNFYRL